MLWELDKGAESFATVGETETTETWTCDSVSVPKTPATVAVLLFRCFGHVCRWKAAMPRCYQRELSYFNVHSHVSSILRPRLLLQTPRSLYFRWYRLRSLSSSTDEVEKHPHPSSCSVSQPVITLHTNTPTRLPTRSSFSVRLWIWGFALSTLLICQSLPITITNYPIKALRQENRRSDVVGGWSAPWPYSQKVTVWSPALTADLSVWCEGMI